MGVTCSVTCMWYNAPANLKGKVKTSAPEKYPEAEVLLKNTQPTPAWFGQFR